MIKAKLKKLLLAEDERTIARALKLKLELSGFEVITATNGEDALTILKEQKIDLLLLDIMMPKVDGFSVMEEMKKMKNKTPIIVLSNLSQEDDIKRAQDLGAIDFFVKSNTPLSEILVKINTFLK
jgi:DNA-binding response OmpR family regulator